MYVEVLSTNWLRGGLELELSHCDPERPTEHFRVKAVDTVSPQEHSVPKNRTILYDLRFDTFAKAKLVHDAILTTGLFFVLPVPESADA